MSRIAIAFDFPFDRRFSIPFGQRPFVPDTLCSRIANPAERKERPPTSPRRGGIRNSSPASLVGVGDETEDRGAVSYQ